MLSLNGPPHGAVLVENAPYSGLDDKMQNPWAHYLAYTFVFNDLHRNSKTFKTMNPRTGEFKKFSKSPTTLTAEKTVITAHWPDGSCYDHLACWMARAVPAVPDPLTTYSRLYWVLDAQRGEQNSVYWFRSNLENMGEAFLESSSPNKLQLLSFPHLFWVDSREFRKTPLEQSETNRVLQHLKGEVHEWLRSSPPSTGTIQEEILRKFQPSFLEGLYRAETKRANKIGRFITNNKIALGRTELEQAKSAREAFDQINEQAAKEKEKSQVDELNLPSQQEALPSNLLDTEKIINSPFPFDPEDDEAKGKKSPNPKNPKHLEYVSAQTLGVRVTKLMKKALYSAGSPTDDLTTTGNTLTRDLQTLKDYVLPQDSGYPAYFAQREHYEKLLHFWTLELLEKNFNERITGEFRSMIVRTIPWLINTLVSGSPAIYLYVRQSYNNYPGPPFRTFFASKPGGHILSEKNQPIFIRNATALGFPSDFWSFPRKVPLLHLSETAPLRFEHQQRNLVRPVLLHTPSRGEGKLFQQLDPRAPSPTSLRAAKTMSKEVPPVPKEAPKKLAPSQPTNALPEELSNEGLDAKSKGLQAFLSFASSLQNDDPDVKTAADWTESKKRLTFMVRGYLQGFGVRMHIATHHKESGAVSIVALFYDETIPDPSDSSAELFIEIETFLHQPGWTLLRHRRTDHSLEGARLIPPDVYAGFGSHLADTFRTTLLGARNCFHKDSFAPLAMLALLLELGFSQGPGRISPIAEVTWNGHAQQHPLEGPYLVIPLSIEEHFHSSVTVVRQVVSWSSRGLAEKKTRTETSEYNLLLLVAVLLDLMLDAKNCTERIFRLEAGFREEFCQGLLFWLDAELQKASIPAEGEEGGEVEENSELDVESESAEEGSTKANLQTLTRKIAAFRNIYAAFEQAHLIAERETDGLSAICAERAIAQATDEHVERLVALRSGNLEPSGFVADLPAWEDLPDRSSISSGHGERRGFLDAEQIRSLTYQGVYEFLKITLSKKNHHFAFDRAHEELEELRKKCFPESFNPRAPGKLETWELMRKFDLEGSLKFFQDSNVVTLETSFGLKNAPLFKNIGSMSFFFGVEVQPSLESINLVLNRRIEWYAYEGIAAMLNNPDGFSRWLAIPKMLDDLRTSSSGWLHPIAWVLRDPRLSWSEIVPILNALKRSGEFPTLDRELPLREPGGLLRLRFQTMAKLRDSSKLLLQRVRKEAENNLILSFTNSGKIMFGKTSLEPDKRDPQKKYAVDSENNKLYIALCEKIVKNQTKGTRNRTSEDKVIERSVATMGIMRKLLRRERFYRRINNPQYEAILENYFGMLILFMTVVSPKIDPKTGKSISEDPNFSFFPVSAPRKARPLVSPNEDDEATRLYSDYDAFLEQFYDSSKWTAAEAPLGTLGEPKGTISEIFGVPSANSRSQYISKIALVLNQIKEVFLERLKEGENAGDLAFKIQSEVKKTPSFAILQVIGVLDKALGSPFSAYKSYGDLVFEPYLKTDNDKALHVESEKMYSSSVFGAFLDADSEKSKLDGRVVAGKSPLFASLLEPIPPPETETAFPNLPFQLKIAPLRIFMNWSRVKELDDETKGCALPFFRPGRSATTMFKYFENLQDELFEFLLLYHSIRARSEQNLEEIAEKIKNNERIRLKKGAKSKKGLQPNKLMPLTEKEKFAVEVEEKIKTGATIESLLEKLEDPTSRIATLHDDFSRSIDKYEALLKSENVPNVLDFFGRCTDGEIVTMCAFDWMCVGIWSFLTDERKALFKSRASDQDIFGSSIEDPIQQQKEMPHPKTKRMPYLPDLPKPGELRPAGFSLEWTFNEATKYILQEFRKKKTSSHMFKLEALYLSWLMCRKMRYVFRDFYEHGPIFGRYNVGAENADREWLDKSYKTKPGGGNPQNAVRKNPQEAFLEFGVTTLTEIPKKLNSIKPLPPSENKQKYKKRIPQTTRKNLSGDTFLKLAQYERANWDRLPDCSTSRDTTEFSKILHATRVYPVYLRFRAGQKPTFSASKAISLRWFKPKGDELGNVNAIFSPFLVDSKLGQHHATNRIYMTNVIKKHMKISPLSSLPSPVQVANRCGSISGQFGSSKLNSSFIETFPIFAFTFESDHAPSAAEVIERTILHVKFSTGKPQTFHGLGDHNGSILGATENAIFLNFSIDQNYNCTVFWLAIEPATMNFLGNASIFARFWNDVGFWASYNPEIFKTLNPKTIEQRAALNAFQCNMLQDVIKWRSERYGWKQEGRTCSCAAVSQKIIDIHDRFASWLETEQLLPHKKSPEPLRRLAERPGTFITSVECRNRCVPSLAPVGICPLFFDRGTVTSSPKEPFLRFYDSPEVPSPAAEPHRTPLDALIALSALLRAISEAQSAIPWYAEGLNAAKFHRLKTIVDFLKTRYSTGHIWNNSLSTTTEKNDLHNDVRCYRIREFGYFAPLVRIESEEKGNQGEERLEFVENPEIPCTANLILEVPLDYFSANVSVNELSLNISNSQQFSFTWFSLSPAFTAPIWVKNWFFPLKPPSFSIQTAATTVQAAPFFTDSSGAPTRESNKTSNDFSEVAKKFWDPKTKLTSTVGFDPAILIAQPVRKTTKMQTDANNPRTEHRKEEEAETDFDFLQMLADVEGGVNKLPKSPRGAEDIPRTSVSPGAASVPKGPISAPGVETFPPSPAAVQPVQTLPPASDATQLESARTIPFGTSSATKFRARVSVRPLEKTNQSLIIRTHVLPEFGPTRSNTAVFMYAETPPILQTWGLHSPGLADSDETIKPSRSTSTKRPAITTPGTSKKMRVTASSGEETPIRLHFQEKDSSINVLQNWHAYTVRPKYKLVKKWLESEALALSADWDTPLVWSSGLYLHQHNSILTPLLAGRFVHEMIMNCVEVKDLAQVHGSRKTTLGNAAYGLFLRKEWAAPLPTGTIVASFGGQFLQKSLDELLEKRDPSNRILALASHEIFDPRTTIVLDASYLNDLYIGKKEMRLGNQRKIVDFAGFIRDGEPSRKSNNCKFVFIPSGTDPRDSNQLIILCVASRNIHPGEEFFVKY